MFSFTVVISDFVSCRRTKKETSILFFAVHQTVKQTVKMRVS